MGSQLLCVDCNYEGPVTHDGDCPRCGSEWTTDNAKTEAQTDNFAFLLRDGMPRGPIASVGLSY